MNYPTIADSLTRSVQQQQQQHQQEEEEEKQQQQQQHEADLDRKKLEEIITNQHNKYQITINNESPGEYLSFCGCGFLGMYHVGVSSCINQYAPHLSTKKIAGSSVGAIVAVAHISGSKQISDCLNAILNVALKARERALGPFHPSFNVNELVYDALNNSLTDDIHILASGNLHVSLTRIEDGQNVIISQFDSKEDVIQALICSSFIPFWSGFIPPKYKGVSYMDGGFSNNLLKFEDQTTTITVSPFAGEADICPQDDYMHLLQISLSNTSFSISPGNMYRVLNSLLPPPPEALGKLYDQGFSDALRYLRERKQLACLPCVQLKANLCPIDETVQSSSSDDSTTLYGSSYSDIVDKMSLDDDDDDENDNDNDVMLIPVTTTNDITTDINNNNNNQDTNQYTDCICKAGNSSQSLKFPELASSEATNKSFVHWFIQSRPVRFFTWITSPCLVPIDVSMMAIQKIWETVPNIRKELLQSLYNLLTFLQSLVVKRKGSKFEIILGGKEVPMATFKSRLEADIMTIMMKGKSDISSSYAQMKEASQQKQLYNDSNNIINGNYLQHKMSEKTRLVSMGDQIDNRLSSYAVDYDNNVNSIDSSDNERLIINKPNSFVSHGSSRLLYQRTDDEVPSPLESA